MSRDPYGPKRRNTARIPRDSLPPTEGSVPDLAKWDPEALTAEECPCCKACSLCGGKGTVPQEIAAAYRAQLRDDPDEGDA